MKKINKALLASVLATCICLNTNAQSLPDYSNVIKINPLSLLVGNCTLFYERQVSNCVTLQLGINFMPEALKTFGTLFTCYGITPEFRIYLSHLSIDVPAGGYFAPFFRYRCLILSEPIENASIPGKYQNISVQDDQTSVGFVFGYQCISEKNYTFDFFAGPFSNNNNFHTSTGQPVNFDIGQLGNDGIGFRVGIGVGFAF